MFADKQKSYALRSKRAIRILISLLIAVNFGDVDTGGIGHRKYSPIYPDDYQDLLNSAD